MSRIQVRRGTSTQWTASNPVLAQGEPGYETNTGKFKIGNGSTAWNSLAYTGTVTSVAGRIGDVTLSKSDVGLSNVDNTADADKNVLSATRLTTARTINGVSFDGTQNITIAGGVQQSVQTITSATTLGAQSNTEYIALMTTGDVTLPTAVGNLNRYTLINTGTALRTVSTTSSQTINGNSTVSLIGGDFVQQPQEVTGAQTSIIIPQIGTGDFTVEFFVSVVDPANKSGVVFQGGGINVGYGNYGAGAGYGAIVWGVGSVGSPQYPPAYGGRFHFAMCRSGTTIRTFYSGTLADTFTDSTNLTGGRVLVASTNIGVASTTVIKGFAKYTSSFTAPTFISTQYNKITVISDGANWRMV